MKRIISPGGAIHLDQQKNLPMPTMILQGRTALVLHDPVFQDGYETGRNACLEHLHGESPRTAITDYSLQTLFVTVPIPADCASPLSWQLGYYQGYVNVSLFDDSGANYGISYS